MFKIKTSIGEMHFPKSAILQNFALDVNDITSEDDKAANYCLVKDVEITIRFKEFYMQKEPEIVQEKKEEISTEEKNVAIDAVFLP